MGRAKKLRAQRVKHAQVKKIISPKDTRVKAGKEAVAKKAKRDEAQDKTKNVEQVPVSMFFAHNSALGPPFHVIVDTNFLNFSIKNKIDVVKGMMDCLLAKCIPVVLDSVVAELEKLGARYRVALKLAKDPRFLRMPSYLSKGTYADDDIVEHVRVHRCFVVATCDKDLRRRIRKIPGAPIMFIKARRYTIERMPEAFGAPR
mmetsp:Transcript_14020/g.42397  ORF Transcript_14020/g.42397 Transcript_14020/m.42397 type:complete len:202 (+) Transcript_14020:48-653(+)